MATKHTENFEARACAANKYIVFAVYVKDGPCVLNAMVKHGINYKTAQGYYKGTLETVFIVNAGQFDLVFKYLWWAILTQESILHLGPVDRKQDARPAILEYMNTTRPPLFLGYFYAVSQTTALAEDAWTKDGDQFYVAALHRPDHVFDAKAYAASVDAVLASNASVRASNRAAVRGHKQAADKGALHHSTRAFEIRDGDRPVWTGPRPLAVKGIFNKAGGARTPSGHEF